MTIEEHLRTMIGDLVLTVARLQAEVDALRGAASLPRASTPPDPSSAGEDKAS